MFLRNACLATHKDDDCYAYSSIWDRISEDRLLVDGVFHEVVNDFVKNL